MKPEITMNEWLAAVRECEAPEPIPKGWQTRASVSALIGMRKSQTARRLRELVRAGAAQRKPWLTTNEAGTKQWTYIYRLQKGGQR